ncbi:MAG: NUDIX domain-containing protein, partial [Chloroflexota bacterium]
MIKKDDQHINICVRAIIIEDGQVVVCRWKNDAGPSFSIGGRVEYGESLVQALLREVKEETGTNATIDKLLYMHENVYTTRGDRREVHELGYYFLVTCDEEICPNNQISSNPDHPSLFNVRVPVTKEGLDSIFPTFLREYLPRDATMAFAGN